MLRAATVHTVTAIGIDMGKNTLHMIGLDPRGAIPSRVLPIDGLDRFASMPSSPLQFVNAQTPDATSSSHRQTPYTAVASAGTR